jgi:hypothetical protein
MLPVAWGELWPLFNRDENLVYFGTTVDAWCREFTVELSLATGTALHEELKGNETGVSAGRAAPKLHGIVPGRDRKIYSHVLLCCRITPDAKIKVEAYYFSKMPSGRRLLRLQAR